MLTLAGKQVVLSTLTLLEAESELSYLTKIARQKEYLIEANDHAAVQAAQESNNAFVGGCALNIYNNRSLSLLNRLGMNRWCIPVELGREDIQPMISTAKNLGIELEYQAFGRMPLAYSARCFTARHHNLPKDNCQFKCSEDEQGILVQTQEDESFAQINGIQTQSAKVSNLLDRWQELQAKGIDVLRIVPVGLNDTLEVVKQLSEAIKNDDSQVPLSNFDSEYEYCNGYWLQLEGLVYQEND